MEMAAGAKKGKRTRHKDRDNGKKVHLSDVLYILLPITYSLTKSDI
jgi:hypothetical protein